MTTFNKMLIVLSLSVPLTYAENMNGKLLDASCYDNTHSATSSTTSTTSGTQGTDRKSRENIAKTCAPTATTTSFAFMNGKGMVYKLDSEGNTKAAAALQGGSLKPDKDGDMHASISGSVQGDAVKVDSIQGHAGHKK